MTAMAVIIALPKRCESQREYKHYNWHIAKRGHSCSRRTTGPLVASFDLWYRMHLLLAGYQLDMRIFGDCPTHFVYLVPGFFKLGVACKLLPSTTKQRILPVNIRRQAVQLTQ